MKRIVKIVTCLLVFALILTNLLESIVVASANNSSDVSDAGAIAKDDDIVVGSGQTLSFGSYYSGAITEDGSLYMWGDNGSGQVGTGKRENQATPVKVLENVESVSSGYCYSGAITKDGSLYMWGRNGSGQVGNGNRESQATPVKVLENVESISLGDDHSGAITKDGSLYMWGDNWDGEVGDGSGLDNLTIPVKVLENVESVSLGYDHSGAITKDGSLYMWGSNSDGEIGNGSGLNQITPVKVLENVESISLGYYHSGAITKDGSLYMWGCNSDGEIGNGSRLDQATPVKVLENVASISLGYHHSGAITKDGSLYMWGSNGSGQIGNGSRLDQATPVKVLENVESISLGDDHSGAITKDGSLYMWGSNGSGQIGNGSMDDQATPVKVLENVGAVSLGRYYSGAITKDGSLYMWGNNEYGQVGNGSTENQTTPVKVLENVKLPIANDPVKNGSKSSEIASNTIVYFDDHGDKKSQTFDYSMDFCLEKDATEYNPDLAYMLAALANSAYHKEGLNFTLLKDVDSGIFPDNPLAITESLRNLGFDAENGDVREFNYFSSASGDNYGDNVVAFTLATREMSDGTALISIVVCGSYNDMTEFTSDWRSNVNFKNLGTGLHEGFDAAAKEIIQNLNVFINDKSIDGDKVKFVITGHSRGAAVANLVAKTLIDSGVPTNSVYDYNFACPDSGRDYSNNWNPNGEYDSLYNINNVRDIVGEIPGNLFNTYLNTNKFLWGELPDTVFWGKYGHTYFFSENEDAVTETMIGGFDQHSAILYLDYMSKQQSTDSLKSWEQVRLDLAANAVKGKNGKIFGVFCPVDIEIIDKDGVKAAEVVNGQSKYYSESFGDVVIVTADDQSLVYVNGNKEYFVIFTGSDTGEMTYCVSDAVSESAYEKEIMYTNVPLSQGKKMVSILNNDEQSEKVTLVLFDEELNPEKQIDYSGAELELSDDLKEEYSNLPLEKPVTEYKITYDLDGGQATGNPTTYTEDTDTFTLNNPTKTGYTFTGWTGSNGNIPELTVTITKGTTGDLSYTANWSEETSNDSGSVSGGDISDSVSGGDISDSVSGGDISDSVSGGDSNNSEDADTTPDDSGSVSDGDISGSENGGDGNNSEDVGADQAEDNSSAEDVSITIVGNSVSNEKASVDYSYKTGDKTGADNILLIICGICMIGCLVRLYMIKKYE